MSELSGIRPVKRSYYRRANILKNVFELGEITRVRFSIRIIRFIQKAKNKRNTEYVCVLYIPVRAFVIDFPHSWNDTVNVRKFFIRTRAWRVCCSTTTNDIWNEQARRDRLFPWVSVSDFACSVCVITAIAYGCSIFKCIYCKIIVLCRQWRWQR